MPDTDMAVSDAGMRTPGQGTVTIDVVEMTPELALAALATMELNRPVKRHAVAKYAEDMRHGRWLMNGETVKFENGHLVDGQNRMHAVVQSGVTIPMIVIHGVDEGSQLTIDTGVPRRFSDYLALNFGVKNTNHVAAVTKRMLLWDQGHYITGFSNTVTHGELSDYFMAHQSEIIESTYGADNQMARTLMSVMTWATIRIILRRIDREQADFFMASLLSGAELEDEGVILVLRNRLLYDRTAMIKRHARLIPSETSRATVFLAWNIWREKRNASKLQLPKGGITLENYPVPK